MEIISQNSSKFTYLTFVIYKTCLSQFVSHMHEAQVRGICWGEGAYLHFTATTPFFWNSLQAVYKWLCSLRFIPWTLVLTQVMTAGLAVVPGRCTHLFRKCLQVQVLWGRGTGQGTQKARLPLPVEWKETGSDGWGVKGKGGEPFPLIEKKKRKEKKDDRVRSLSFLSSTSQTFPLSRVHKHMAPGSTEEGRTRCVTDPAGSIQPTHARVTTLVVLTKLHHTSRRKKKKRRYILLFKSFICRCLHISSKTVARARSFTWQQLWTLLSVSLDSNMALGSREKWYLR